MDSTKKKKRMADEREIIVYLQRRKERRGRGRKGGVCYNDFKNNIS